MNSRCPNGYRFHSGDKIGWAIGGSHYKEFKTIEECAIECNKNEECLSIEWSEETKHCNLLNAEIPDGPKYMDAIFCAKMENKYPLYE